MRHKLTHTHTHIHTHHSIADLEDFLASPPRVLALVDSEAKAMAAKHGNPRKTAIISEEVDQDPAPATICTACRWAKTAMMLDE